MKACKEIANLNLRVKSALGNVTLEPRPLGSDMLCNSTLFETTDC